jgi:hypothetical protein
VARKLLGATFAGFLRELRKFGPFLEKSYNAEVARERFRNRCGWQTEIRKLGARYGGENENQDSQQGGPWQAANHVPDHDAH